jgi:hypothetical protein
LVAGVEYSIKTQKYLIGNNTRIANPSELDSSSIINKKTTIGIIAFLSQG